MFGRNIPNNRGHVHLGAVLVTQMLVLMFMQTAVAAQASKKPADAVQAGPSKKEANEAITPFLGYFKGEKTHLTIRPSGDKAIMSFVLGESTFEFDGKMNGAKLVGTLLNDGTPFDFVATIEKDKLTFLCSASTYLLIRSFDPSLILGKFETKNVSVTVEKDGEGYSGTLTDLGGSYPFSAKLTDNLLKGTVNIKGQSNKFEAQYESEMLHLSTGGGQVKLTKTESGKRFNSRDESGTKRTESVLLKISNAIDSTITLSPDNRRVAYLAIEGIRRQLVLDGKPVETMAHVIRLRFSDNGKRFSYAESDDGKAWRVVVDQEKGELYEAIGDGNHLFSPDGSRYAYAGLRDNRWHVVIDGKEKHTFDLIRSINFSPDGKHYSCVGTRGEYEHIAIDGVETKGFRRVNFGRVLFSPNGKRTAYISVHDSHVTPIIDGVETRSFDAVQRLKFSPDSKRIAMIAVDQGRRRLVVDGKLGKDYFEINHIRFNPSSDKVAYVAREKNESFMVVNGIEDKNRYLAMGPAVFSNDNRRMAFIGEISNTKFGRVKRMMTVVVNGQPGRQYESIRNLQFSPDGQHLHYLVTRREGGWQLVVDGDASFRYERPPSAITFSKSGAHFVFVGRRSGESFLVVDGVEGPKVTAEFLKGGRLIFETTSSFYMVVRRGDELLRYTVDIAK